VKPNPQQISIQSANPLLLYRYNPEYKIQDVHLVAILDFGAALVFVKEPSLIEAQSTKKFRSICQSVVPYSYSCL
jgi:hypothetical protein